MFESESLWCFHPQLERRHEQMKRNLEAQYKELEEKRRVFEDEKANWDAQQRILEQQKLDASKSVTLTPLKFSPENIQNSFSLQGVNSLSTSVVWFI